MDLRDGHLQRICKAHLFDETFRVNSALNAEVFVAAPHAVAMEFDLFWGRRISHGIGARALTKFNRSYSSGKTGSGWVIEAHRAVMNYRSPFAASM